MKVVENEKQQLLMIYERADWPGPSYFEPHKPSGQFECDAINTCY